VKHVGGEASHTHMSPPTATTLAPAQVTACTDGARAAIEGAGGSVTRVYYTAESLKGLLKVWGANVCALARLGASCEHACVGRNPCGDRAKPTKIANTLELTPFACARLLAPACTHISHTTPPCTAQPELYTSKRLPLPLPAHSWHPKHGHLFDAVGQTDVQALRVPAPQPSSGPRSSQQQLPSAAEG